MKTRKYIIFMIAILGVLLSAMLASCDTTPQTSGDENTQTQASQESDVATMPATQNEIDETQMETISETEIETELQTEGLQETNVETTVETEQETMEETQGETENIDLKIPNDDERVVYVSLNSENMGSIGWTLPAELKSSELLPSSIPTQTIQKENMPSKNFTERNETFTLSYENTTVKDADNEIVAYYGTYDSYRLKQSGVSCSYYSDGRLKKYRNRAVENVESENSISSKEAIEIAKAYILEWWDADFDFEAYTITTSGYHLTGRPIISVSFIRKLHGYTVEDHCAVRINSNGEVFLFDGGKFGICEYLEDVTPEMLEAAANFLERTLHSVGFGEGITQGRLELRDDGKIYMEMGGLGWTYENGMITENSVRTSIIVYTCVNP